MKDSLVRDWLTEATDQHPVWAYQLQPAESHMARQDISGILASFQSALFSVCAEVPSNLKVIRGSRDDEVNTVGLMAEVLACATEQWKRGKL